MCLPFSYSYSFSLCTACLYVRVPSPIIYAAFRRRLRPILILLHSLLVLFALSGVKCQGRVAFENATYFQYNITYVIEISHRIRLGLKFL